MSPNQMPGMQEVREPIGREQRSQERWELAQQVLLFFSLINHKGRPDVAVTRGHLMETKIQPFPIVILPVLSHPHRWHSLGTSTHSGRGGKKEAI